MPPPQCPCANPWIAPGQKGGMKVIGHVTAREGHDLGFSKWATVITRVLTHGRGRQKEVRKGDRRGMLCGWLWKRRKEP